MRHQQLVQTTRASLLYSRHLRQVQLPDFAAHVLSQAAGKRDHARQLTGISSDQLKAGSADRSKDIL